VSPATPSLLFTPPALALGARSLPAPAGVLAFAVRSDTDEVAGSLRAVAPSARVERGPGAVPVRLLCAEEELRAAAGSGHELAALLDATRSAWAAAPGPPRLMGVVNATPDSFSDGGRCLEPARAVEHGLELVREGADWIDVGGESTRPGAAPVSLEEELRRVLPVVEGLAAAGLERISIDTRHAPVARAALAAGGSMVNDVGAGLDDAGMLPLVAEAGCRYALMHRRGDPADMQRDPRYADPVGEVCEFLRERAAACLAAGIEEDRLLVDPGIGFGKTLEHNLALLRRLGELRSLGLPLLVGVSRKSFIAHVTGRQAREDWRREAATDDPSRRIGGTAAAVTFCVQGGARLLRVHDVAVMAEAVVVARALNDTLTSPHLDPPWTRPSRGSCR